MDFWCELVPKRRHDDVQPGLAQTCPSQEAGGSQTSPGSESDCQSCYKSPATPRILTWQLALRGDGCAISDGKRWFSQCGCIWPCWEWCCCKANRCLLVLRLWTMDMGMETAMPWVQEGSATLGAEAAAADARHCGSQRQQCTVSRWCGAHWCHGGWGMDRPAKRVPKTKEGTCTSSRRCSDGSSI